MPTPCRHHADSKPTPEDSVPTESPPTAVQKNGAKNPTPTTPKLIYAPPTARYCLAKPVRTGRGPPPPAVHHPVGRRHAARIADPPDDGDATAAGPARPAQLTLQDLKEQEGHIFSLKIVSARTDTANYNPADAISNLNAALQEAMASASNMAERD